MKLQHLTISIGNLSCGGGGTLMIERALKKQDGVTRVYVNPTVEMAFIEFDPERISIERLCDLIEQLGFDAGYPTRRGRR